MLLLKIFISASGCFYIFIEIQEYSHILKWMLTKMKPEKSIKSNISFLNCFKNVRVVC